MQQLGRLDVLVNNAGAAPFFSTVDAIRLEGFEKYFRINFLSAAKRNRRWFEALRACFAQQLLAE
jgi:NAD(P)-dependent dehydrogenase (short-subunit alcohol dehydrogenase family)